MLFHILPLDTNVNEFLTNADNHEYTLVVNPPGSFGERVRSRSERGGSCFISIRPYDPDRLTYKATCLRALLTIQHLFIYILLTVPDTCPEKNSHILLKEGCR